MGDLHNDVDNGDVDQVNEEPNKTHHQKSNRNSRSNLFVLYISVAEMKCYPGGGKVLSRKKIHGTKGRLRLCLTFLIGLCASIEQLITFTNKIIEKSKELLESIGIGTTGRHESGWIEGGV